MSVFHPRPSQSACQKPTHCGHWPDRYAWFAYLDCGGPYYPMRFHTYFAPLLNIGCAAPTMPASPGPASSAVDDLSISLNTDITGERPVLIATIVNRSTNVVCLREESLRHPDTWSVALMFRNARGRSVGRRASHGYPAPPLAEIVRLQPGERTAARYYLDWRLGLRPGARIPRGTSAQLTLQFGYCEDVWSLRSTSSWQPI